METKIRQISKDQGRNLATLRRRHGYTQATLAEALNMSQQTISSKEKDSVLDEEFKKAVAKLFHVDVKDIEELDPDEIMVIINARENTSKDASTMAIGENQIDQNSLEPFKIIQEENKYLNMLVTELKVLLAKNNIDYSLVDEKIAKIRKEESQE